MQGLEVRARACSATDGAKEIHVGPELMRELQDNFALVADATAVDCGEFGRRQGRGEQHVRFRFQYPQRNRATHGVALKRCPCEHASNNAGNATKEQQFVE